MMRIHRALLAAGLDSRVLYGYGGPPESGSELQIPPSADTVGLRLFRKAGIHLSTVSRAEAALGGLDPEIEQFSHPFSRFKLEGHPWIHAADVINLHWVSGFLDYPRFFKSVVTPIIWTLHDQNPYLGGFHYEWERDRFPEMATLENEYREIKKNTLRGRPIHVVGNSEWNTQRARKSGFFSADSTFQTIYYPIDSGEYYPLSQEAARHVLGIKRDLYVLGFACHDLKTIRKGFDFLADLLPKLEPQVKGNAHLLTFGQEPPVEIRQRVGISWKHLGYLHSPDFQRIAYSAMDCFLMPSRAEAFGQTAVEAVACGASVLASRVGGLIEALDQIPSACLCEPDDSRVWLDSLGSMLFRSVDKGRAELSLMRHDPAEISNQLRRVYEHAIQAGAGANWA